MRAFRCDVLRQFTSISYRFLIACVLLLGAQPALLAASTDSQQEDGGSGKKPVPNIARVSAVPPPGFLSGGGNLGRYFVNPNGSRGSSGVFSSPTPATADRTQEKCDETDQPVVIGSGNKVLDETDFATADGVFVFTRTYSSLGVTAGFGHQWRHPFAYVLTGTQRSGWGRCPPGFPPGGEPCPLGNRYSSILLHRPDGVAYRYSWNSITQRYEDSRAAPTSWIIEDEIWRDTLGNIDISSGGYTLRRGDGGSERYNGFGRVQWIRDVRGVGYTYTYDPAGNHIQKIRHTNGREINLTFSPGRYTSVTDPSGKVYTYGYDGSLRLTTVTYPDGLGVKTYHYEIASQPNALTGYSINGVRKTRYAYKGDGRVDYSGREGGVERDTFAYGASYTDVTNALGYTTRYNFSGTGGARRISSVSRPASTACTGGTATTDYGANSYVSRKVDFEGYQTFYTWNDLGQLQEKRSGVGPAPGNSTANQQKTTYGWDVTRNLLTRESHYGKSGSIQSETVYTYHPDIPATHARLLQKIEVCAPTCASGTKRTTTYAYVLRANRVIQTLTVDGPLAGTGDAVTYQYDTLGNLTSTTNGLGHATTWSEFNGLGLPGRMIDANGLSTRYTWDAKGRNLTTRVQPASGDRIWTNVWRPDDQLASIKDPTNLVTTFVYDAIGRRTEVQRPSAYYGSGATVDRLVFTYNALSQVTRQRMGYSASAAGALTVTSEQQHQYDIAGYLARSFGNDGQEILYDYNGNGQLAGWVNANGHGETYLYDSHGRTTTRVDALSNTTTMAYDVLGRLSSVTDPRGKTTSYVYNGFGELTSQTSPDTGLTTHTYDAVGRRATTTDARSQLVTFGYDALYRPTTATASGQVQTFTWDTCSNGKGRICQVSDPTGSVSYTYTAEGQVATQASALPASGSASYAYTYDAAGRLIGIGYPSSVGVGYGYTNGALRTVTVTLGGTPHNVATNIAHEPFGGARSWTYGNGLARNQLRDINGRMTEINTKNGTSFLQKLNYDYDTADRMTNITNGVAASLSQTYGYDPLSRLLNVSATGADQSFAWDANNNRTSHTWGGATDTYSTATPNNRLSAITGPRATGYTYDAAGNTLSGEGATFTYNAFGRLASAVKSGVTATYAINALGQRIYKKVGATDYWYLYGPGGQMLSEYQSHVSPAHYVWLDGTPIARVKSGQVFMIHSDHLGRPEIVTNSAKAVVWRASNYAFDRTVTLDSIGGLNLGFPGQYHDTETGLAYNYFRTYNPRTGRYLESDPIGLAGGLNTYAYVGGNPVSFVDPLGLLCINSKWKGAIAGAAAGVASTAASGKVHPLALAGMGLVGGGAGYYLGDTGSGAVTGMVAGGAATRSARGAVIGGITGGLAGAESGALVAGTMGAIDGGVNSPKTYFSKTHWSATAGPALKGVKSGLAGWAASEAAESAVDWVNTKFGDCACEKSE